MGAIETRLTDNDEEFDLLLEVTPYQRAKQRVPGGGGYPPPEEDEWEWLREKAESLLTCAESLIEPPGSDGIFCKFCEAPIKVVMLNDYLEHLIAQHNVKITAVILGERPYLETNVGRVEL